MNKQLGNPAAALKRPVQQRSRLRLALILDVASGLIAARGSDELTMTQIARQAGISIASLYQYFPDKATVIRALAERYNAECRASIQTALTGVNSAGGLLDAYGALMDEYCALLVREPAIRDIWSAMQTDPVLRRFEMQECRYCSTLLVEAILRVWPRQRREAVAPKALLLWSLGNSAARLALEHAPGERQRLFNGFKHMALKELAGAPGW